MKCEQIESSRCPGSSTQKGTALSPWVSLQSQSFHSLRTMKSFSVLVVCIILIFGMVQAFNIFDFFHQQQGGERQGSFSWTDHIYTDLGQREPEGQRCSGYLCHLDVGPCVPEPEKCPCKAKQYRCNHGPSGAFSCVSSADICKKLISMSS